MMTLTPCVISFHLACVAQAKRLAL